MERDSICDPFRADAAFEALLAKIRAAIKR